MALNGRPIDATIEEATALEEAGLLREALNRWRVVVAQESTAVSTPRRLGRVAAKLNEWREAENAFLAALAAAPEWSLPYEALGLLHRDGGDLVRAEDYFRQSLAYGEKARTLTLLGDVLERLGKTSEAESTLREAIRIDPSYEEAHFLLAQSARDDPQEAISLYRSAIALDPAYAAAHRELGWTFRG